VIRKLGLAAAALALVATGANAQTTTTRPSTLDSYISVATSTDKHQIKATPGVLVGVSAYNTNASTDAWLKCTNLTAASTTPGSSTIFFRMFIPHGAGAIDAFVEANFSVALTCYLVTGSGNSNTTAVAADEVVYNLRFR
jgi:hypothetical protein